MRDTIAKKFCRCIQAVRRTVKIAKSKKEGVAIAICVNSVLKKRGKTLKKFRCKPKASLQVQPR
jgi:hypothetical protein